MGKPAARITDLTAHGGMATGPGCPTVLIGKLPAATIGDMHVCPMCTGPVPTTVFVVSGTLVEPDGSIYKEENEDSEARSDFQTKKKFEIRDAENNALLASGEIGNSEELSVLVPDVEHKLLIIDGVEYQICNGEEPQCRG